MIKYNTESLWPRSETMEQLKVDEVSSSEWRWVIIVGGLLVALTMIPYAWAFTIASANQPWQFMGLLHNPIDGATYLSKINLGIRGAWLFTLEYTPEPHTGAAINLYYLLLGHLARVLNLSSVVMFHLARLIAAFFMYIAIYHLGSTVWQKLRPRRLFFALMGIGAGFGWLAILFFQDRFIATDFSVPESIPFYATLVNPHFALSIALICLLAATFIRVFRPGFDEYPRFSNGGLTVALLTVILCLVQPQGWVGIVGGLGATIAVTTLLDRRLPQRHLLWASLAVLPAIPILVYYFASIAQNPALQIWNAQNITPSPNPLSYVAGFGLPLLIALPGIWRAIRHFERDGDRFMLLWLGINAVMLYMPLNLQRRLSIGLIIPITYFAIRSLEDFWFPKIARKWRTSVMIAIMVLILPSNALSMMLPLFGIVNPKQGLEQAQLLTGDAANAIHWLAANGATPDVVLAAPTTTSRWVPAYSNLRVVYGHPFETLLAGQKLQEVNDWYQGKGCTDLIQRYNVRYIVVEPPSAILGDGAICLAALGLTNPVQVIGSTRIYATR